MTNKELIEITSIQVITAEFFVSLYENNLQDIWQIVLLLENKNNSMFVRRFGRAYRWALQNFLLQKRRKLGISKEEEQLLLVVSKV